MMASKQTRDIMIVEESYIERVVIGLSTDGTSENLAARKTGFGIRGGVLLYSYSDR
jgi:hypothetical protein